MRQNGELGSHGNALLDGLGEGGMLLVDCRLDHVVFHCRFVDQQVRVVAVSYTKFVKTFIRPSVTGIDDFEI
jgi:hypothetical protein